MADPGLPEWAAAEFRRGTVSLRALIAAGVTSATANAAAAWLAFAGSPAAAVATGAVGLAAGAVTLAACTRLLRSLQRTRIRLHAALLAAGSTDG